MKFPVPGLAAAFCLALLIGCADTPSEGSKDPFSVKFTVASVPRGLPLDSIEITIAVGDGGDPQRLTVDTKNGVSKGTVQAYPGQKYALSFKFFSGGYEIARGASEGTFAKDMSVALEPEWDNAKVDQAYAAVHSGKYLPGYLDSAYGLALAGKPLGLSLDSAAGKTYRWWVRLGDSIIAEGEGTAVDWSPADSLGGRTVSVKVQVLNGSTVVDERKWDVRVLAERRNGRPEGIAIRNDTASARGSLIRFRYAAGGNRDSLFDYDTTVYVKGREPVSTVGYAYIGLAGREYVKQARRANAGGETVDSAFEYDDKGRLVAVKTSLKTGTTVDSLFYGNAGAAETRAYAQGKQLRVVRHSALPSGETVDSIFSRIDSSLVLSRLVRSVWRDSLLLSSRTWVERGGMQPSASDRYIYNGLGSLALRYVYAEGQAPELTRSETYLYDEQGRLARALYRDETTGELERVQSYSYAADAAPKTASSRIAAPTAGNRIWLARLAAYAAWDPSSKRPGQSAMPRQTSAP